MSKILYVLVALGDLMYFNCLAGIMLSTYTSFNYRTEKADWCLGRLN